MELMRIAAILLALLAPGASGYGAGAPPRAGLRAAMLRIATPQPHMATPQPHAHVVFVRHGQSIWNEASLFTGWSDVELTTLGKNEAAEGATQIWKSGLKIDVAFTSLLKRAQQTLELVLLITGQEGVPVHQSWRLNERMYGALTGLNKKETVEKFGEAQVKEWRRSYTTPPPPIDERSPYWPGNDNKYIHIPMDEIPRAECLKDTVERTLPYWEGAIAPALRRGKTVLIAAHGNSIRGLVKHLDRISDAEIVELEIPTGIPLHYALDADLRPIPLDGAVAPLSGEFLADDPAEVARARDRVANQAKLLHSEVAESAASLEWERVRGLEATKDLREVFDEFDTSRSGSISTFELRAALRQLGEDVDDATLEEMMAEATGRRGGDHSGAISFAEFVAIMRRSSAYSFDMA